MRPVEDAEQERSVEHDGRGLVPIGAPVARITDGGGGGCLGALLVHREVGLVDDLVEEQLRVVGDAEQAARRERRREAEGAQGRRRAPAGGGSRTVGPTARRRRAVRGEHGERVAEAAATSSKRPSSGSTNWTASPPT